MKITIPRLFDATRVLATEAGAAIQELVEFSQQAFEQLLRALRNNLTFTDNFRCQVIYATLKHGVEQEINTTMTIGGALVLRAYSSSGAEMPTGIKMRLDASNHLFITVNFLSADATRSVTTRLLLLGE